jgi:hypothetical protein
LHSKKSDPLQLKFFLIIAVLSTISLTNFVFGHTVDSVGNYRLEIGWMNEPVVSGETNGIELFVSPLDPNLKPEEQEFTNGITGLEKKLKIQLVYNDQKVTLPLSADHNIPGKYYTFVDPTRAGYYQANILGEIDGTVVSISMHPPRVENKTYLAFPEKPNQEIMAEQESLRSEINQIKQTLDRIEDSNQNTTLSYVAIGLGIAGIVIGSVAFSRRK